MSPISGTKHKARVVQRVVLLFLLSALIPIAAVGAYTYFYFPKVLAERLESQLNEVVHSYNNTLGNRLLLARQVLITNPDITDSRYFESVQTQPSDALISSLLTTDDLNGKQYDVSLVIDRQSPELRFGLLLQIGSESNKQSDVLGWMKKGYFLGQAQSLANSIKFCLVSDLGKILNCPSESVDMAEIEQMDEKNGLLYFELFDGDQTGIISPLGFPEAIKSEHLSILAFQSTKAASSGLGLGYFFPLVFLLALAVAVLVSLIQIRRLLQPMNDLLKATHRISRGQFNNAVEVHSGDEFQALARAFNMMSQRLGKQFEKLHTGAEMDRLILESGAGQPILERALKIIPKFIACEGAAVCVFEPESFDEVTLHTIDREGQDLSVNYVQLSAKIEPQQQEIEYSVLGEGPIVEYLLPLEKMGARIAATTMIRSNNDILGVLCLGLLSKPEGDMEAEILALKDRLSVVLSAVERERELFQQAHYDSLTGLANRHQQLKQLHWALKDAAAQDKKLALLFIDLDRFKNVNDSLGHSEGDGVLVEVANRFNSAIRKPDSCARLGGDEFVVLLSGINSAEQAEMVADRLLGTLDTPIELSSGQSYITASIGIAIYPEDGEDAETLMRNADAAMYVAKEDGRARKAFFSDKHNQSARKRLSIHSALRSAIRKDEFELAYQPLFCAQENHIVALEALVRWPHGPEEFRSPSQFIPIAEELGLINEIGLWVAEIAMSTQATLLSEQSNIRLGINISPVQVRETGFASELIKTARRHQIQPSWIDLEMTEHTAFGTTRGQEVVAKLNEAGFRMVLDDFGTGYSSLSYLNQFPIQAIKLDRSFITNVEHDSHQRVLVRSIINLAYNLGKETIGEGVETKGQAETLRQLGCDQLQGYYFCKPLNYQQLIQKVQAHEPIETEQTTPV